MRNVFYRMKKQGVEVSDTEISSAQLQRSSIVAL